MAQLGKLSGQAGEVCGRFDSYSLQTTPAWHSAPQAVAACGRVVQALSVTLWFDSELAATRKKSARIAAAEAEITLDDLRFRGRIVQLDWRASIDADGQTQAAAVSLQLVGYEL